LQTDQKDLIQYYSITGAQYTLMFLTNSTILTSILS